jgi:hypothetical protein
MVIWACVTLISGFCIQNVPVSKIFQEALTNCIYIDWFYVYTTCSAFSCNASIPSSSCRRYEYSIVVVRWPGKNNENFLRCFFARSKFTLASQSCRRVHIYTSLLAVAKLNLTAAPFPSRLLCSQAGQYLNSVGDFEFSDATAAWKPWNLKLRLCQQRITTTLILYSFPKAWMRIFLTNPHDYLFILFHI